MMRWGRTRHYLCYCRFVRINQNKSPSLERFSGTEEETKKTEAKRKGVQVFGQRSVTLKVWLPGQEAFFKTGKSIVVCALMENAQPQCGNEKWCRL